jgi:hypothetical protein
MPLPEFALMPLPILPRGYALEGTAYLTKSSLALANANQRMQVVRHTAIAEKLKSQRLTEIDQTLAD